MDYPTYVRAQFYWFDLWFHRAPKIYELAGQRGKFPASLRLTQYLELNRLGKIGKDISSPNMPKKHNQVLDPQILDKINRQRLNQLCSVYQLTEEQCLEQFAPAGLFDLEWLKQLGYELQREKGS